MPKTAAREHGVRPGGARGRAQAVLHQPLAHGEGTDAWCGGVCAVPRGAAPAQPTSQGGRGSPCLAGAGAPGSAVPRTPGSPEVPPQALGLCLGAWGALGVALGKLCSHRTWRPGFVPRGCLLKDRGILRQ